MTADLTLTHRFVEEIPERLDELTIYVSIPYATVVHLCPCGCGSEVVTPLGRFDWRLIFDGESISLWPSIGNWNLPCQSHYWIRRNRVRWAPRRRNARSRPAELSNVDGGKRSKSEAIVRRKPSTDRDRRI